MRRSLSGSIPDALDPDASGWPFRSAAAIFGSREFTVIRSYDGLPPTSSHGDAGLEQVEVTRETNPGVHNTWWEDNDVHTPALLCGLRRGDLVAFGDPERAGSKPIWIPRRLWLDLAASNDAQTHFEGGGASFWNVRVIPYQEVSELINVADQDQRDETTASVPKDKGGRPPNVILMYPFVAELVRLANLDGLPSDMRELKKHMLEWGAREYRDGGAPESTVKSWLGKFVPDLK